MALDQETIAALYAKKRGPGAPKASTGRRRLTRKNVHYPTLPKNHLVRYIPYETTKRCTSFGCGAPTNFTLRSSPLCSMHLVFALVHEVNLLSHNGANRANGATQTSGVSSPSLGEGGYQDTPLVTEAIITSESGEDGDSDSYL